MTQPAKAQEPSMEEILASIRRIIADDEAKPAAAEKPPEPPKVVPPAAKPAAVVAVAPVEAAKLRPAKVEKPPAPAPAATNSQDDIDAMLAGLDAETSAEEVRPPQPDGDVFELTDDMALPEMPPAPFQKVEPNDDLEFAEAVAASVHTHANANSSVFSHPAFESQPVPSQQILSHSTVSAVESAFHSLANTVLSNNARTLEDLVKEMLRPMLKSWLDDNLPGLVERIVKAEIERVSRGR